MQARQVRSVSYEEYAALDEAAAPGVKLELFDGVVYCNGHPLDPDHPEQAVDMAGASPAHVRIVTNLVYALRPLDERGCFIGVSDQRTALGDGAYAYPDLVVTCRPPTFGPDGHVLQDPELLIEVASASTERQDRSEKLHRYTQRPSLLEYWIVEQDEPAVTQYVRRGDLWALQSARGADARLRSDHFDLNLALADIYRRVLDL